MGPRLLTDHELKSEGLPFFVLKKRHLPCGLVDDWRAALDSFVDATPCDRASDNSSLVNEDGNSVPVQ